jgi:hypothetical protein
MGEGPIFTEQHSPYWCSAECEGKLQTMWKEPVLEFVSGFDNKHGKLKSMQSALKLRIKPGFSRIKSRNNDDSNIRFNRKRNN